MFDSLRNRRGTCASARPVTTHRAATAPPVELPAAPNPSFRAVRRHGPRRARAGARSFAARGVDVARIRERTRRRRLWKLFVWLAPLGVFIYYRIATTNPIRFGLPHLTPTQMQIFLPIGLIVAARHRARRPDDGGREVAARALRPERDRRHARRRRRSRSGARTRSSRRSTCSSATRRSASAWAATRARRSCSKARPAPARRTWRRPWRARPACRSCSCRRPRSSRCTTAQTGRKIRNYFKELRKAAREEGGAIGFIEEIDAIAGARSGMRTTPLRLERRPTRRGRQPQHVERGHLRRRQRAADPAAVVRHADGRRTRARAGASTGRTACCRRTAGSRRSRRCASNILVIGATNRAADLDPALLRPGRFDRSIHFDLPSRSGRREIIDYYLDSKAHVPELDKEERRDAARRDDLRLHAGDDRAPLRRGARVGAARRPRRRWTGHDVQQAKMTEEIGLKQPVEYTEDEKRTIATHEAGSRGRRVPRRPEPQARGAVDHQAPRRARSARALRQRGALHAARAPSSSAIDEDRVRRHDAPRSCSSASRAPVRAATSRTRRRIAAQMVGSFGMAGSLVSFEAVEAGPITQGIVGKVLANEDARHAVERLLDQAKADVHTLLDDNRHLVIALRDELLDARRARRRRDHRRAARGRRTPAPRTTAEADVREPRRET